MDVSTVLLKTACEPRPYQRTITDKVCSMFAGTYADARGNVEQAARSVMVESPTGSGKTVMGHLIAKVQKARIPDLVIGWVAMRRNLLTQAKAENEQLGINVRDIHYISMFDKNPTALMDAKRSGRPILMIVDECQHDAASSMAHLHNVAEPEMILGLTATPFRTDRVKLCFDKVVKDAGIHQLIQDGYLSQYHHYSIPSWDPEVVAERYCAEPERWGKSVVFFHQWEDCLKFERAVLNRSAEVLRRLNETRPDLPLGRGLIEVVRGGGSSDERDELLTDFRDGNVAVLANCMVLTEGFDAPNLETAFVRDSVKGPTMQMAGRAFRKHPEAALNERFKYKNVVQSARTSWPIMKTALAARQFLWQQDEWRSLTLNAAIEQINNNVRFAISQTTTELPTFLTGGVGKTTLASIIANAAGTGRRTGRRRSTRSVPVQRPAVDSDE